MNTTGLYRDEHLEINLPNASVCVDDHRIVLTRKEFELLALLSANEGEILPRNVLLDRIWGYSEEIRTRTLDVHIRRLRKKFGNYGDSYIQTIFGVGYRFQRYREPRGSASFNTPMLAATA